MQVKLLTTPEFLGAMEYNAAYAMLTCHTNTNKLMGKARPYIERAIKAGHESILEHITLTYEVNNLSRACLQELARHRHLSLSVESTRHTLKNKLISNNFVVVNYGPELKYTCGYQDISLSKEMIKLLKLSLDYDAYTNDEIKYYIPEFWPTNLVLTSNIRELRHVVKLRTAPAALKEFQELARKFVEVVPSEFKYLLEDCVYKNEK